ncbi:MAG: hypothetical protein ACKVIR_01660 [Candidatus Poseidoniales archaeon]
MGRYERAVKSSLKDANHLATSMVEQVGADLRRREVKLQEIMRARTDAARETLNEVALVQDAIIAGSTEVRKSLDKAQKRMMRGGNREEMADRIIDAAARLGELKKLHEEVIDKLQAVLAKPPHAVEIIEDFTSDVLKMAASWEAAARQVDESISDAVDQNPPAEMAELHDELNTGGYDLILSGNQRDPESIAASREKIRDLISGGSNPTL